MDGGAHEERAHEEQQQAHLLGKKGLRLIPVIIGNVLGLRIYTLANKSDETLIVSIISLLNTLTNSIL